MCDISSLNRKYLTYTEPDALFWSYPNCGGVQMGLQPGIYENLDKVNPHTGQHIGRNNIDSMYIPPNMTVDVFNDTLRRQYKGRYNPGLYKDLDHPYIYIGRNRIDSLQITRTKPWVEHLSDCCTGKTANGASPDLCGQFWGKGANHGMCDDLMEAYCLNPAHKDDPKCSCYGIATSPNDTVETKMIKAMPKCWSSKCASKGYIPSSMANTPCPNVKICKQNIQLPGNNNILKNSNFIQDCSSGKNNPSTHGGLTATHSGSGATHSAPGANHSGPGAINNLIPNQADTYSINGVEVPKNYLFAFILLLGVAFYMFNRTPQQYVLQPYAPQPYAPQQYRY